MTGNPTVNLPDPHADPYGFIGFICNSDGSVARKFEFPVVPASFDPSDDSNPILTKDVTINETSKTSARIFLPRQIALESSSGVITKLPLIVDFHGGGFVCLSAGYVLFQDFYTILVTEIPAVIVSIEYRLAPEHRLPAAYDDGVEALHWIKNTNEECLLKYADLANCFLFGCSAGGNIAYNVGLRACSSVGDLLPVRIRWLILLQPFFGGRKRTQSELRLLGDKRMPPCVLDIFWDMSLPAGIDRDHEYCNPTVAMKSKAGLLDEIKRLGWKILVKGCYGGALVDRQIEFVKALEENGLQVESRFEEGGFHGSDVFLQEKVKAFVLLIKQFISM